jgi:aminoglycoside phosphotransferase (APT) family kinase protein
MSREHRILSALGPTQVPVPRTYALCLDESVNGRPFYVMEFVEGHILRDAAAAEGAFSAAARPPIADHMADTLASLHGVDVDAVGLGDLGRREGYVERQLRRWSTQYASSVAPGEEDGLVVRVAEQLGASVPPQREATIVHGDYRLDNVVLDDTGRVRAILDWEICTLGDPLADVGTLLMYWTEPSDELSVLGRAAPTTLAGFASRSELLARYAKTSGRDVSDIAYYTAFANWRLACILQGVYTRYLAGAGAGDQNSVEGFLITIHDLAERAAGSLESGR